MEIVPDFIFCASKSLWTVSVVMKLKYACSLEEMLWQTWLLLLFSHSVIYNSLWPHELQHARLPYPSSSPGACSNSCPLSQWCHPTISSSVIPLSSCLQSFPRSGSFSVSWLFASGGQSIGASASASVLPMNTQDWFSDKPRQHIKNQSHHCVDKRPYSQSYSFSSSHIQMWELDPKEGWALKNWCFWTVVLEKTLESLLDRKEIKRVNPKGNQPWIFIGRTNAPILKLMLKKLKLKLQYFGHLIWRANSLEKILMLLKTEGRRRRVWQRMGWLDSIIDSMDTCLSKLQGIVQDREAWHFSVYGVTMSSNTT